MAKSKTTLLEAMAAAHTRRRYYLHRRVACFTKVLSLQREIVVPVGLFETLTKEQKKYIEELVRNYGYSSQIQIPD